MGLQILFVLIPVTLVLAGIGLLLFVWAIRSGQFDDLETPALRILFDDAPPASKDAASQDGPDAAQERSTRATSPAKGRNEHGDFPLR